jgi:hypothetical protein
VCSDERKSMKNRIRLILLMVAGLAAVLASCSDSGDSPNKPVQLPTISINDVSVNEGGTALFKVSISEISSNPVRFTCATSNVTAVSPDDYISSSGTDTIPVGDSTVLVMVATVDDVFPEADETYLIKITAVYGATLGDSVGIGTILDSDVSFATQVRPLLQTSCAKMGCHGGGSSQGGMALGTATFAAVRAAKGNIAAILVADSLVVQPYSSTTSVLYTKTTATPPAGSRMPSGAAALSLSQQGLIRDWIDMGAPDN